MKNKASITALMSAFGRAYHAQNSKNPIFCDTVARKLMTDEEYAQIKAYIVGGIDFFAPDKKTSFSSSDEMLKWLVETQIAPTPLARAKFCEDALKTAVMTGTTQYVILGAGMDTFAWRESELMQKLTVFEVDYPQTQEDKKARIQRVNLDTPDNLHFVAMDFRTDSLKENLMQSGFDKNKKTFFSWLGVSYYLTEAQIDALLTDIYSFAAEGSSLAFDFADEGLFDSKVKRVQNMLAMAAAGGEPMKFCTDYQGLEKLLERHSFLIYELLTPCDIERAYFGERDDNLTAFEHISYALTVLKGTHMRNTKENILLQALKLFARDGYEAVSVRDIAGKLGITQAALYKHYKNKRDIFDSIVTLMNSNDSAHAADYEVPSDTIERMSESYKNTSIENVKRFALAQFQYWTQDEYAAYFRRVITIEQYRNEEMSQLYHNHLAGGVIKYLEDLFGAMPRQASFGDKTPKQLAIEFYAPILMMMGLYDAAENKDEIVRTLRQHITQFACDETEKA